MAEFRIDQSTPGAGVDGRSRHDLVPGEVITLVATNPVGPGVSYAWEVLDQVGTTASLSSTSGVSVSLGPAGAITQPCAFLIKLTTNNAGVVTETLRIASVRTASVGLRVPVFPETAPTGNTLLSNSPDLSTDNAEYPDRAGLGASGQNWRGWAEWAWELTTAVESLSGGAAQLGTKFNLRSGDAYVVPADYQYIVKSPGLIVDPGASFTLSSGAQLVVIP